MPVEVMRHGVGPYHTAPATSGYALQTSYLVAQLAGHGNLQCPRLCIDGAGEVSTHDLPLHGLADLPVHDLAVQVRHCLTGHWHQVHNGSEGAINVLCAHYPAGSLRPHAIQVE